MLICYYSFEVWEFSVTVGGDLAMFTSISATSERVKAFEYSLGLPLYSIIYIQGLIYMLEED
jgi:hypothetical protein